MSFNFSKPLASYNALPNTVKIVTTILSALSGLVAIVTGVIAVDARYTHDEDFQVFKKEHVEAEQHDHREFIERRISEYETKKAMQSGKLSEFDSLMLSQAQARLADLENNIKK
jgi:hypothetical protein